MKNQYFGDARDYLKYHLLEELVRNVPGIDRLTILWMLTANDTSNDGNIDPVSTADTPLARFLRLHREPADRRTVQRIAEYFESVGVRLHQHGETEPFFTNGGRRSYFAGVPDEHLDNAVVFLDPDNGITQGATSGKHVSMAEMAELFNRMGESSVLVVIQFRHRKPDFWPLWARGIEQHLNAPVRWVSSGPVAFYVIPKPAADAAAIDTAMRLVAQDHPRCSFDSLTAQLQTTRAASRPMPDAVVGFANVSDEDLLSQFTTTLKEVRRRLAADPRFAERVRMQGWGTRGLPDDDPSDPA